MNFKIEKIDVFLAVIGIIISIILTIYVIMSGKMITYLMPGIFVLISCIFWVFKRKSFAHLDSLKIRTYESKRSFLTLISLFFILLMFSILSIYFSTDLFQRPVMYFVIVSIMISILVLEIFYNYKNRYTNLILLQIILIELSLVYSQQLIFPSVTGVDPSFHLSFTDYILNNGYILKGSNYNTIPLFHLEVAITSLFTNLNYKLSTMLSIDIIRSTVTILFIYIITRYLFNDNIGLLSALLLSFANIYIQFGWWTIPNTIAAIYIPMIIYLLLFKEKKITYIFLIFVLMFALILTHPMTSLWMDFVLLLGFVILTIFKIIDRKTEINFFKKNNNLKLNQVNLNIVILFTVMMIGWWMYSSGIFNSFIDLLNWGLNLDASTVSSNLAGKYWSSVPIIEHITNNLALFIYFGISIIGFLYIISSS